MKTIQATMQDVKDTETKLENKIQVESDNRHDADNTLTTQFFTLQQTISVDIPKIHELLNDIKLNNNTNDIKTENLEKKVDTHIKSELGVVSYRQFIWTITVLSGIFSIFAVTMMNYVYNDSEMKSDIRADLQVIKTVLKLSNIE